MEKEGVEYEPMGESIYEMTSPPEAQLTKWQLTVSDLLMELEKDLRGERWVMDRDSEGHAYGKWEKTGKPTLNEVGIREVLSVVRSHVNKITFLTDFDDEDIERICKKLHITLAKFLIIQMEKFELDINNYEITMEKLMNPVFAGLKKSLHQGERDFLKSTERRIERISEPIEKRKRGRLISFFR